MVNRKTPITFSPCELNTLLEDPHSCVILKKGKRHLALHPSTLGDIKKAIKENLNSTVTQFDAELDGILLGVTNVKVLSNEGTIVNDSCYVHLDVKARFYIFKPQVGCQLTGVVKKLSTGNIGCLVHNVFNVAIPRQEEGSTDNEIDDIELGNQVTFTVEYLDFSETLPYIRGKLIPVRGVPHGKKRKNKEGTIQNKKRKTDMEEDTENNGKSGLFHELESSRAALFSVKQTSKPTGVCDEIERQSDPTTEFGETYSKREKKLLLNEQPENLSSKKKKKDKKREKGTLGTVPRDLKEIISEVEERIKKEAVDDSSTNLKEIHGREYESKQLPAVEMKSTRKNKHTAESFVEDIRGSDSEVKVPLVKKVIKKEMSESPSEQNLPVLYEHTKKKKKKRISVDDENSRETETMAQEPFGKKKRKRSINAQEEGDASEETPSCVKNARSHVEVNDLSCNVSKLSDEEIPPKKKKKEKHWNKTQEANFGMKVKKESAVREHSDLEGIALNDLDAYVSKKKKKKIKFEALNISEETNADSSTPSGIKVGGSKESEKKEGASSIEFGAVANNFSNDEVKKQKTSRSDRKEPSTLRDTQDLPAEIIKKQAILSSSGPKQVAVESELESSTSSKHGYNKRKKKHEEMLPQVNTVRLNQLKEDSDQTSNSSDTKIKERKLKKEPKASPKPTDLSMKGVTQKSTLRFLQSADQNQISSTFEQLSPIKKSGILDASNEEEDDDYSFATSTQIVTSSPYNTSNTKTCSNNKDLDLRRLLHRKKDLKAVISKSDVSYHCDEASGKGSTKMHNRMNITPDCCTPNRSPLRSKPKEKISLPYSDSDSDIEGNISLQTVHNFSEQRISKKSKQKQDSSDSLSGSHSGLQIDKEAISKKVKIKEKSGTKSTQHTAIPSTPSVQKHFDGPIERNDEFTFLNQAIKSKSKRKDLSKHSAAKLSESDMATAPKQEAKQVYFMQQHTSEHELSSGVKNQDEVVGKTLERRKKKAVLSIENQELISYKDAGSSNRGPAKKQELGLVSSKYFGFGTPPVVSKSPQTQLSASPKHERNCLKDVSSPKKKTSDQVTSAATSAHSVDSESDSDSSSSKVTKVEKKISPFRANVTQMETNQFSPIFSKTQSQSEDSDDSDDGSASEDLPRNVTNKQCGVPVHKKASPVKQKYLPVSTRPIIGSSESAHSLPKGSKYKDKLSSSPKKNRVPVVSSQIQKQGAYINTSDSDDDDDSESDSDSSSSKVTKVEKKISPFRANVTQMETNQFSPIFSKTQSQSEDSDDSDDSSASEDLPRNVTSKQCGVPVHKKASPVKQKYLPVSTRPIIGSSESDHSLPKGSKYKDKLSSSPKKNRVPVVSSQIQKQGAYINTSDSDDDDDFDLPLTQKSPGKGRIINTLQGDESSGAKINTNGPTMKQSSRKQKEMRAIPAPKSEETNNHVSVFKKSNSKQRSPKQQLSIQENASNLSSTVTRKNEMEEHSAQDSDSVSMQSDRASSNNPLQISVSPNKRSPVRQTTGELPKATKINKSSVSVKSVSESESSENSVKLNIDPRSLGFDELLKSRQLTGNLPASLLRMLSKQQTGK